MVLVNAGKMARNAASIVNRPTCGGTAKKAGLSIRSGFFFMSSNPQLIGAPQRTSPICTVSRTIQTQKYGYSATHGGNMG